ncbi:MAG: bifunctional diaminohydroxyphosphoribosylaminopyrimidine deaminase/5-amino-6-(5-phosphoribosylamino)uracil reductase RibD [Rickettsiales bacterium]
MPQSDISYMQHALRLAARCTGTTAPNPGVGCVIIKEDAVIGRGWTQPGGRPHAETVALAQAGAAAKGATMYVTLEPCAHQGQTPPCTDALIKAGIARVVVGCADMDPRVAGKGIAALQNAGIEVVMGICEAEAQATHEGFFMRLSHGQPLLNLKIATSLDGKIAHPAGAPRWITSEQARMYGHMLRAEHDAIVTGIGTALTDNPMLTCRIPGLENRSPVRVVLDSTLLLPENFALVTTADKTPTWIITTSRAPKDKMKALEAKGITIIPVSGERIGVEQALHLLAERGMNSVLLEAGTALTTSALASGLVSSMYWFRSPQVIGDKGKPAFASPTIEREIKSFRRIDIVPLKEDVLEIYKKRSAI